MAKRTRGIKVTFIIAVLLAAAGVYLVVMANVMRLEFLEWIDAKPVDFAVDVSQPGEFSAPFHQTCSISHGEVLCLAVPEEILAEGSPQALLSPLRFESVIRDEQGNVVVQAEFDGEVPWGGEHLFDGAIPLVRFRPFAKGDYILDFRITQGAPELAGVPARLMARYELCGMEMMPAFLALVGGVGAFLLAMIMLLAAWVFNRRLQKKEPQ